MFIKTLFKGFAVIGLVAVGVTSAVVFSNLNNSSSPYLKVLTKEKYLSICKDQNIDNSNAVAKVSIDYGSLPTSSTSFVDLLMQKNLTTNAFILTVGSQAYSTTNNILVGQNETWSNLNPNLVDSSALMLKLYDLFYNSSSEHHKAITDYNINFYSFIDVLNTQEITEAANLFQYRRTQLGVKQDPDASGQDPIGVTNVWDVKDPETNVSTQQPVIKTPDSASELYFKYEPSNSYYEFRPDAGFETEYEKVYYRNQDDVSLFNNTISWANNYASQYLVNFNIASEGSIILAKKTDGLWSFKSISTFSETTFNDVLAFYNSDYNIETGEVESDSSTSTASFTTSSILDYNNDKDSICVEQLSSLKGNNKYKVD